MANEPLGEKNAYRYPSHQGNANYKNNGIPIHINDNNKSKKISRIG